MALFGKKKSKGPEDDARKFSRTELLEMLIEETKEAERLKEENEQLKSQLAKCQDDLEKAASLSVIMNRLEGIIAKGTGQAQDAQAGLGAVSAETPVQESGQCPVRAVADPAQEGAEGPAFAGQTQEAMDRLAPAGLTAASAGKGFRHTTRDPQTEDTEEKDSYPPADVVMQIRPVGFRLAGMRK